MTWDKFLSPESNLFNWGSFLEFWPAFPKGVAAEPGEAGVVGTEKGRRALWLRQQLLDRSSGLPRKTLTSCVLIGIVMGKKYSSPFLLSAVTTLNSLFAKN